MCGTLPYTDSTQEHVFLGAPLYHGKPESADGLAAVNGRVLGPVVHDTLLLRHHHIYRAGFSMRYSRFDTVTTALFQLNSPSHDTSHVNCVHTDYKTNAATLSSILFSFPPSFPETPEPSPGSTDQNPR
jgi:hypothetical protein